MMAHWYCRECKQTRPEEKMLTGWNGPWCPNCVLDEVSPIPAQALLGQIGQTPLRGAAGQSQ